MPQEITKLSPLDEILFKQWIKNSGITDLNNPDSHYDYRGYWAENKKTHKVGEHFPDTFKQHGHPTFSIESKYSNGPQDGGRWENDTYIPQPKSGKETMPLKVKSGTTGKIYEMPWSKSTDPSDDEIDSFIASQELGSVQEDIPTPTHKSSMWEKANTGLVPVEKVAKPLAEPLYQYGETHPGMMGQAAMYGGAATEALGNTLRDFTSPLNLALAGVGPLAKGVEAIAPAAPKIASGITRAAAGLFAGNAAKEGIQNKDPKQLLPFILGALGAKGGASPKVPQIVDRIAPETMVLDGSPKVSNQFSGFPTQAVEVVKPNLPHEFTAVGSEPPVPLPSAPKVPSPIDLISDKQNEIRLLSQNDLGNAETIKNAVKPKVRATSGNLSEVDLINPSATTIDAMGRRGYHTTGELQPDGSLKMTLQDIEPVQPKQHLETPDEAHMREWWEKSGLLDLEGMGGMKDVTPKSISPKAGQWPSNLPSKVESLSAPNEVGIPSFPNGGNGAPPSLPINEVASVAPVPKPKVMKYGMITKIGGGAKSLMAGADLSAPLRQGRALMHKSEFYKAIPEMFKAAASEKGYQELNQSIQEHPKFEMAQKSNLSFTDLGNDLNKREENLISTFVGKLPIYKQSNRAYTGFLNKLRMDTFSSLIDDAQKAGREITPEFTNQVADFVNVATGRGKLSGSLEAAAPALNAAFFAPRFVSSRIKLLTAPVSYMNADPFVRKEALKSLFALGASQATIIGLATLAGAKTSTNLTSSDFAKVKVGNTRVDTNAGLQQYVTLAARLWKGELTSSTTGKTMQLNTGKFGSLNRMDVVQGAIESREAPLVSLVTELMRGKDSVGNPTSLPSSVIKRVTPMLAQDLYDIYQDDPKSLPLGLVALFGGSVQTYKAKPKKLSPTSVPRIH